MPLINDREVSKLLCMSSGWVRNQRHRRRHGEEHSLTIDPVMIGSSPRYRLDDLMDWIESLGGDQ